MSLSANIELTLIADAQAGDHDATAALLAEYEPNLRGIIRRNPGYDADDLRSELVIGLLETINNFNSSKGERLWPTFAAGAELTALDNMSKTLYAMDVPIRTARLVRSVYRRVEAGEDLDAVIATEPHLTRETYLTVESLFGKADLADYDHEPEREPDRTTEFAEVALDGMDHMQRALCRLKYGFEVPIPTDCNSLGLPDAEVAEHYSVDVIGETRAAEGELAISRAGVQRKVAAGLLAGKASVVKYLASDGVAA